ncbi:MAG: prepilin-type N-terminal cleavage/methylation domain-containing protein, partial [Candidatus Sumerlaeia bacterium]|nr:prepilin-type N-terminal cleavage/methylation domain-containing protein [Candidatus Sumerlaeia bacterium]
MSPAPRALTLLELLVAVAVVAIGAVGAAQLIAHALRLAER